MIRQASFLIVSPLLVNLALAASGPEVIDPEEAKADPDFALQGEYLGEGTLPDGKQSKAGAQAIAQGDGAFRVVLYRGGLPGDGWKRGEDRFFLEGKRNDQAVELHGDKLSGQIADGKLSISDADGKRLIELKRTERKSPTLGEKPPAGATVLFDGSNVDRFPDGTLSEMKTLQAGCTMKPEVKMAQLHLEFRLSWKPKARGQGRSNSGVYIGGCPEIQVLDAFGLEGAKNECAALYGRREPDVNMCLPPLTWQTYDVEFSGGQLDKDGRQVEPVRMTVRHNGVVVHQDYEVRGKLTDPRRLHLQQHGNRVQYRNIWVVEPK